MPPLSRFVVLFDARGRSFSEPLWAESGIFENQGAAVSEWNFSGSPVRALVEALGLCGGGVPFLVEPVQVRIVIGDPFLDGLPGWLDRLHGFDIVGRRWAWNINNSFPEAVEAVGKFDFALVHDLADGFHDALAAGALERVAAPDLEDEIVPEGRMSRARRLGGGGMRRI